MTKKLMTHLLFVLFIVLYPLGVIAKDNPASLSGNGELKTGTIEAINIEERHITINNNVVEISDDITISTNKEMIANLLTLQLGQQVHYWVTPQDKKNLPNTPPLPQAIVTKIHILTGLNENAYQR